MILRLVVVIAIGFFLGSCATKVLKYDKTEQLKKNSEFENAVKIEIPEEVPEQTNQEIIAAPDSSVTTTTQAQAMGKDKKKSSKDKAKDKKKATKEAAVDATKPLVHEPELESSVGFEGRRPIKDPFRVGERVVHEVTYLKMSAGLLTLEVKPFAMVNGRKSYNFYTGLRPKGSSRHFTPWMIL